MSSKCYIESTRWVETSSKLKTFKINKKLYKIIFIDEKTPYQEEIEDMFVSGTAIHFLMESIKGKVNPTDQDRKEMMDYAIAEFNKRYWISDGLVMDELRQNILQRIAQELKEQGKDEMDIGMELEAQGKRLRKTTIRLADLREEWHGTTVWADIKERISLTPTEGKMVLWMFEALMSQPIMDVMNKYTKEQTITATYSCEHGDVEIWTKPDRLCIYRVENLVEVERWTLDEYMEIVKDMSIQEKMDYAKKNNIRWILRDWKSTQSIKKIRKELIHDRETAFGYVFSMSTYFTILYIHTGIQFETWLDLVEKQEPFLTESIALSTSLLYEKMTKEVIPTLKDLAKTKITQEWTEPDREEILNSTEMMKYYKHFDNSIQTSVTYMNDLLTDLSY